MKSNQPLLQQYVLGDLVLKNRVVMAPMTRSRANNKENAPTDRHATYYRQRASAGLIISEGSQISKQAVGYINTPGIYSSEQVNGWKKVTRAVHEEGGKIFVQLWHTGRISHPDFHQGALPLAPSAINPHQKAFTKEGFKDTVVPKAMDREEIRQTVRDFATAAKNAMEAGFDGVEIHSSNGYLLHQFFSKSSNIREDEYGGSPENRARILFEIIAAIKQVVPENRIGIRLNPYLSGAFGITADEETLATFDYIVQRLNDYDLAYLHISEFGQDGKVVKKYRPLYKGTLIVNNGFDQKKGNEAIAAGEADLVAFGKLFISNPDLPERFAADEPLAAWDQKTFYTPGDEGYIDYPKLKAVSA